MARIWTEAEYRITHAIYENAMAQRGRREGPSRAEIIELCRRETNRKDDGSVVMHLQNMSAARLAIGLTALPEFGPLPNFPRKLGRFLRARQPSPAPR